MGNSSTLVGFLGHMYQVQALQKTAAKISVGDSVFEADQALGCSYHGGGNLSGTFNECNYGSFWTEFRAKADGVVPLLGGRSFYPNHWEWPVIVEYNEKEVVTAVYSYGKRIQ